MSKNQNFKIHIHRINRGEDQIFKQNIRLREVLTTKPSFQKKIIFKIRKFFLKIKDFLKRRNKSQPLLLKEGYNNYNIIYFDGKYYGLHQLEGVFDVKRLKKGKYKRIFSSETFNGIIDLVKNAPKIYLPILIEEGFLGFNIIAFGNKFYAIGQEEGYFDIEKVNQRVYKRIIEGQSVEEIKSNLKKALNINGK